MRRFRVNEPNVVFEAFDEEIVAVNLDTGNYYSLSKTGPKIWIDVAAGFGIEEIAERIQHLHTGNRDEILAAVTSLVDRLVAEQLIVDRSDTPVRSNEAEGAATNKTPFEAPVIENFTDMQDLLMLDPIHEVDAAGWPVAKTNS